MIEQAKKEIKSGELALELYDSWVRERQRRTDIRCSDNKADLEGLRRENFMSQHVKPRQRHLAQLKEVAKEMTTADKVALLVMMELPTLEISTLLHRLSKQLADDPKATYFSKANQIAACGCGCG